VRRNVSNRGVVFVAAVVAADVAVAIVLLREELDILNPSKVEAKSSVLCQKCFCFLFTCLFICLLLLNNRFT